LSNCAHFMVISFYLSNDSYKVKDCLCLRTDVYFVPVREEVE
jgi:hypothetical protein